LAAAVLKDYHFRMPPSRTRRQFLLYLVIVVICANSSNFCAQTRQVQGKAHSKHAAPKLDRLVSGKRYPELEHQLASAQLTVTERSYFEGIFADRCNHVSKAISILKRIMPSLRKTDPGRAATALRTLASDYFKVGRYADASAVYSDLLQHFAAQLTRAEKSDIDDSRQTLDLLRNASPQTVSGASHFTLPLRRDPLGDLEVPLRIGNTEQWWIFDTGANASTVTLSTAKRLGLTISQDRGKTHGGAEAEVRFSTTVIPQVTFGDAIISNVVALVTDDKDLDIDLGSDGHYQIQGILGYPVLAALGSFTVTGDELVVSSHSQPSPRSTKLYVDDLTPLVTASVNGRDLLFALDTGNASAQFTVKYLREFPRQFAKLKTAEKNFAGAGGGRDMTVYHLAKVELGLGTATARLQNVPVHARELGTPLDQVFGNLGQGLLSQFRSYTIDFSDMRLTVSENVK
jgi:predicted aspartyl protease